MICAGLPIMSSCFNTQPPKGGWATTGGFYYGNPVSTHSRLKAAGGFRGSYGQAGCGFNTQPPKGGWLHNIPISFFVRIVSTHSRLKAAGRYLYIPHLTGYGFNTQPPKGGWV